MKISQKIDLLTNAGFVSTITGNLTAARSHALPDRNGTFATVDQIPSSFDPVVSISASKTFALTDAQTFQLCTNSTAITLTIPADATVNFPIGSEITIAQDNTGSVTIAQGTTAVNIRRMGSTNLTGHIMMGQYALCLLKKVAANEWRAYGGLSW